MHGPKHTWVLVDSGAECNFINQSWTKEHLNDIPVKPKQVRTIDSHRVFAYGQWKIYMTVKDLGSLSRTSLQVWEAVDIEGYDAILGTPWLDAVNPLISCPDCLWIYHQTKSLDDVEIIPSTKAD